MKAERGRPGTLHHFFSKAERLSGPAPVRTAASPSRRHDEAAATLAAASAPESAAAGGPTHRQPAEATAMLVIGGPLRLLPAPGEHSSRPAAPREAAALERVADHPPECAARHSGPPSHPCPVSPAATQPAAPAAAPDSPESSPVATCHVRRMCMSPESSPDASPAVLHARDTLGSPLLVIAPFLATSALAALDTAAAPPPADDSQRQPSVDPTQPAHGAESAASPSAGASPTEHDPVQTEPAVAAESAGSPEQWRQSLPRPGTLDAFLVRRREPEDAAGPSASGSADTEGPSQREPTGNGTADEGDDEQGAAVEPVWLPPAKRRRGLLGCVL